MALIPRRAAAMAGVAALVVAADQVTKSLVLAGRISGGAGWASVRLVRNTGSAGGLASGHPLLVALSAAAITGVACAFLLRARGRGAAPVRAALLGGGG